MVSTPHPVLWATKSEVCDRNGSISSVERFANIALPTRAGFVETFSPISDDIQSQKEYRLMLDGIQTGLIMLCAPMFQVAVRRTKFFEQHDGPVGAAFDVSYGVL